MTIVPDDKDGTWVLERPCPECGFGAHVVALHEVPASLRDLVGGWQQVLVPDDVAERPLPDRWSPLEYGCHVRDVFRIFDARLQLMLAHDGATFENWDQDATAAEERYALHDPTRVSLELAEAGEALALRFAQVEGPEWEHRGLRSNGSEFTVVTLAVSLLHDPIHHLWDVSGA